MIGDKYLPVGAIVGVIGTGTMGAGIAQVLLMAGYKVLLYDQQLTLSQAALKSIDQRLARLVEKEVLSKDQYEKAVGSLQIIDSLEALSDSVMVVEAIVENLEIKQTLFRSLEKITSTKTIFATNTSSISITAIASALQHPSRLAGWHFFNPAPLMALVEVVKGLATSDDVAKVLYDTAHYCGKTPVYAKSTPGFIVNRVARPFYAEAMRVLNETAEEVALIDLIMRKMGGFKMGPFELMDLIGNDVNYAVTESVWKSYYYDARFTPSLVQKEYVDAGFYGRKSRRGFYHYDERQKFIDDFDIEARDITPNQTLQNHSVVKLNTNSPFAPIWKNILQREGIVLHEESFTNKDVLMFVDGVACFITSGLTATELSYQKGFNSVVVFDFSNAVQTLEVLALARNKNCQDKELLKVGMLLARLGIRAVELSDTPGLLVMRTIAMLANEAADAVNQGVADITDVDTAMRLGVGYPKGPLQWADEIGIAHIVEVLKNLYKVYGDSRYRVSPKLQEKYYLGENFYD